MAHHWYKNESIAVDSLITTILTQLKDTGGWTETDEGYNVLTNPNATFDVFFYLEVNGTPEKRYLQFEVGESGQWNTGTHVMDVPKITFSMIIRDSGTTVVGTELGLMALSYDDDHLSIILDYTSQGAGWQRIFGYLGLCEPFDSGDECLIGASCGNRGSTVVPAGNDVTTAVQQIHIMDDISGSPNKTEYMVGTIAPLVAGVQSNSMPKISISSAVIDKRFLIPIYLMSNSLYPVSVGEDAGIRCYLKDAYCGCYYDGIANGQTLLASDNKEYWYFIYDKVSLAYQSLPLRVLVRKS